MPNGGSDNCMTCWFNRINKGYGVYLGDDLELSFCVIRNLKIHGAAYRYCVNHPNHSSEKYDFPIGSVYAAKLGSPKHEREEWVKSPDSEEIRIGLLKLLDDIEETRFHRDDEMLLLEDAVIWQLGEFREKRAIDRLEAIVQFDPSKTTTEKFVQFTKFTVELAKSALEKINIDNKD